MMSLSETQKKSYNIKQKSTQVASSHCASLRMFAFI